MKRKTRRVLVLVVGLAGLLLALAAQIELRLMPNTLQFCALPSTSERTAQSLQKQCDKARETLGEAVGGAALSMIRDKEQLTSRDRSAEATVYAVGEGWFEVYPRFLVEGRRISEQELKDGIRVMMMDEGLAFSLFGSPLPENPRIDFLGHSYRMVGTVRHAGSALGGRGVGDLTEHDIYVPLRTALEDGFEPTVEMLSAAPMAATGIEPQFLDAVKANWRGDGTLINLYKEAMRVTIMPRLVFMLFAVYALMLAFKWFGGVCAGLRRRFNEALTHTYLRQLWPRLLTVIIVHIAGYAALIAVMAALTVFFAEPIYVFPEWVPENFVAWSSITRVFWNLTTAAAGLVRVGSREFRIISFWGGALRWGTILMLIAFGLRYDSRKNEPPKEEKEET